MYAGHGCNATRILDDLLHRSIEHRRTPERTGRKRETLNRRAPQHGEHILDVTAAKQIVDADIEGCLDRCEFAFATTSSMTLRPSARIR